MNKKHHLLYIAVIALAFTCILGATALADSPQFTKQQSYEEGLFKDITAADWYYRDIVQSYEYGFITVSADMLFHPKDDMTVAALLSLACRIRAAYDGEAAPQNGTDLWYLPYVEYAIAKNIIAAGEFTNNYTRAATRGEAAHILANTLPETEAAAINQIGYLPDVAQAY